MREKEGYCEQTGQKFYKSQLQQVLIKNTNIWDYFLINTIISAFGIFTNVVCLAVFIHSKYLMPKMGNVWNYLIISRFFFYDLI